MNKTKFYILYSKFSRSRGGYIALTSAVIIVMIIISIISALSLASYFSRSNILTSEFKDLSLGLAEGCAEKALLKYSQDSSYIGNENILIGGRQCSILPIETSGSNKIIKTFIYQPPNCALINIRGIQNGSQKQDAERS